MVEGEPNATRAEAVQHALRRVVDFRQFSAYLSVGLIGTGGHYLSLMVLVRRLGMDPVPATTIGFTVGAVINYFANYYLTFRSRQGHVGTMMRFFVIALAGMAVNAAVMALGCRAMKLHYMVTQVVATGAVVVLTYLGNRFWTFREVRNGKT